MKKILLLIDDLGQGGAERQMIYLARELSERACEVRLVKFYPGDSPYASFLESNGSKIEIMVKGMKPFKRIWIIYKLVKSWQPDLTIAYKDGSCIAACIARIFYKFKLIVSERNTTQRLNKFERIKFFFYRFADGIVPNSYSQNEFIKRNYPNLVSKLRVITNMVDLRKFQLSTTLPRKKKVIIVARLAPQKNVINLLKALKEGRFNHDEVHFDWYGKVQDQNYFEEILSTRKELGLEALIVFHSNGSNNIEEEYRNATHFCLPSLFEGFPNVLCEAMASGLICVASNVCDNQFILEDNDLLFNPVEPSDIASKLKYTLNFNSEEMNKIKRKNRMRIEKLCSSESFGDKYLALL